jgi:serine protease AprX
MVDRIKSPEGPDRRPGSSLDHTEPRKKPFEPEVLDKTVIAIPLLNRINARGGRARVHDIIIDVNLDYRGGRGRAKDRIVELVAGLPRGKQAEGIDRLKSEFSDQYLFGRLSGASIRELVRADGAADQPGARAIYRIWPDFDIESFTDRSVCTIKADAARNAFGALGDEIVWAVVDTGIDGGHPHFREHKNLDHHLGHRDFSASLGADEATSAKAALDDEDGHGTHVAGIIAGRVKAGDGLTIEALRRRRNEEGDAFPEPVELAEMSGMAPRCKLLSLKALGKDGKGKTSSVIAAINYVQHLNGYGRRLQVHGVNLSVGYDFEPEWFACGQSPLCVEVDRLVRSGVVVVAAAGNTGYGVTQTLSRGTVRAGMDLSINDPGNAELAITVGSTHRDMPHTYGVSYFSSKGPTGDGRMKPDLVAPGEKILSCDSDRKTSAEREAGGPSAVARYREDSGTSMAAPHVSGAIAAFLSIRREFIGQAEAVRRIFLASAMDLNRAPNFQGKGLVDLMRAIQSV